MKFNIKSLYIILFVLLNMVVSCTTKFNNTSLIYNTNPDKTKLNQLFSSFRSVPQQFTISAGTNKIIYAGNGTKFSFYPNSFKDATGTIITNGNINLQIVEMYRVGIMAANRTTAATQDGNLISGGQIYINATMNGQPVFATKYGIGFKQNAASTSSMSLYYGNTNNDDSLTFWTAANNFGVGNTAITTKVDSETVIIINLTGGVDTVIRFVNYYQFDSCINLNWVNCDNPYGTNAPLTDLTVTMPDTSFNATNTEVFVLMPAINCVVPLNIYNPITRKFDIYHNNYIPVDMNATVFAISNKHGNYYYYEQTGITITSGINLTASMTPQSATDILKHISSMY